VDEESLEMTKTFEAGDRRDAGPTPIQPVKLVTFFDFL
jgi:hypothetical protein